MKILNKQCNTQPLILHAPGKCHKTEQWNELIGLQHKVTGFDTSLITIITFMSGKCDFVLKEQLESNGISYINLVQEDLGYWSNRMKIYLLSNLEITTPYVLCLDAIDILLGEDLSELLNRFESSNCDILYNATKVNYPLMYEQNSCSMYLNAGAFIGKVDAVKDFYTHLKNTELYKDYERYDDSEQIRVRNGLKTYAKSDTVKLDEQSTIFQTLGLCVYKYVNNEIIVQ